MSLNLNLNFFSDKTELCEIGAKYDTDKSAWRNNVTNIRHCHPYTIFYDTIFGDYRNNNLEIAEIGILDGASLLMWNEYFPNVKLTGFEYNRSFIEKVKGIYTNNNLELFEMDITNADNIKKALETCNKKFDIIIEDSTHQIQDQIRFIRQAHNYLKDGGILIIEDIFKHYNEKDYINNLSDILHEFQDYYFVTLDHINKNSYGWNNDKLFILVKKGEPIFKNKNKITVITPCSRIENIEKVRNSINLNFIDQWIIVYDNKKIIENPKIFNNEPKITELIHQSEGISGNPQRNFALDYIKDKSTFIYFLDDDNIIHPDFYRLIPILKTNKIYTFNQTNRLIGNKIKLFKIDTAMFLIDYNLCRSLRWKIDKYDADGFYITECYHNNNSSWIFVNNNLCYYNYISNN